jgi:asparagine synthase (glutamine-hydrolysing)
MRTLPIDVPQPIRVSWGTFALEGEAYSENSVIGVEEIARKIKASIDLDFHTTLVKSYDGAFVTSAVSNNQIFLARDTLGLSPLYCGESSELYAAASERKALWAIGINSPEFLAPGNVATVNRGRLESVSARRLDAYTKKYFPNNSIHKIVLQQLLNSTEARTCDTSKVAVAFSGGLDSGLIAVLAKSLDLDVMLLSIGMEGSRDLEEADRAAKELRIPITTRSFDEEQLEQSIGHVLWHVEDRNSMKLEVAIAMGWLSQLAAEEGYKVVLTGQGGDELFAGYSRFARIYTSKGPQAARQAVTRSILESHMTNYSRDEQISAPYKIRVRHPFADCELTRIGLSIPIELNLDSGECSLRKKVLRQSARLAGVPQSIAEAPKRAVQYGSGIHKALSRIAKARNLSVDQFIERINHEIDWKKHPLTTNFRK